MHMRPPSIDQGVIAVVWAVGLAAYVYFGLLAIGSSGATAIVIALLAFAGIWLLVRLRGEERPVNAVLGHQFGGLGREGLSLGRGDTVVLGLGQQLAYPVKQPFWRLSQQHMPSFGRQFDFLSDRSGGVRHCAAVARCP